MFLAINGGKLILKDNEFQRTPLDFLCELGKLLEEAIWNTEIDYYDLESYEFDQNPYECYWDELEEYQVKLERFKEYIRQDGWGEYLDIQNTRWMNEYLNKTPAYERVQNLIIKLLDEKF